MLSGTLKTELSQLSLKDYFKKIEDILSVNYTLEELTKLFSDQPFTETKPYLIRRQLRPFDNRFSEIEIVYDNEKVGAIVWDLKILLSQLTDFFGQPHIHNEPYDNSTAFTFISQNPRIQIIKARHPKWLTELTHKNGFEYRDEKNNYIEIKDPEFSFIQFSLAE